MSQIIRANSRWQGNRTQVLKHVTKRKGSPRPSLAFSLPCSAVFSRIALVMTGPQTTARRGEAERILLEDVQDSIRGMAEIVQCYKNKHMVTEVFTSVLCRRRQDEAEEAIAAAETHLEVIQNRLTTRMALKPPPPVPPFVVVSLRNASSTKILLAWGPCTRAAPARHCPRCYPYHEKLVLTLANAPHVSTFLLYISLQAFESTPQLPVALVSPGHTLRPISTDLAVDLRDQISTLQASTRVKHEVRDRNDMCIHT